MKTYDYYQRGEIVIVLEKGKDENGKKIQKIVGKAKIISSEKSTINYSLSYIPWTPVVSVAQDVQTGTYYSNSPYSNLSFIRASEYIECLKKEKEELLLEIKEIDELINYLKENKWRYFPWIDPDYSGSIFLY